MDPGKSRSLLFVHSTGPTHVYHRDKVTKTQIRRHIMQDIGRSRRRARRNQTFDVVIPPSTTTAGPPSPKSVQRPFWQQDPLTILAQQWGMDLFSAYGISLLVTEGKNPGDGMPSESFFFPFAFTSSKFLHHFQSLFSNSVILQSIHHGLSLRGQVMALDRSLATISCVEGLIANLRPYQAAGDRVISAVLAIICYNLLNQDFGQARVHMEGLKSLIAAQGGIQALDDSNELRLMIFWIDVTFMLLFNTMPQYPIPSALVAATPMTELWDAIPTPLSRVISAYKLENDAQVTHVASCMVNLSRVASCLESRLADRGSVLWRDEMFVGMKLNPIAHELFHPIFGATTLAADQDQATKMIRLGGILWILWIKRISRSYPGSPIGYVSELLSLLDEWGDDNSDVVSDEFRPIILWLASICTISCAHGSLEWRHSREWMAKALHVKSLEKLDIEQRRDAATSVRQMPWISVFEPYFEDIWADFNDSWTKCHRT